MVEIFVDIIGYEGKYQISNFGTVVSLLTAGRRKIIKPTLARTGYYVVGLYKEKYKSNQFSIHRLIATHFIPNPNNEETINHINEVKTDNRIENLEWCPRGENSRRYLTGKTLSADHKNNISAGVFKQWDRQKQRDNNERGESHG